MAAFSENELKRQLLDFLKEFKELMGQGRYIVKGHYKNIQTLKDLGITARLRDELILSIALQDYSSGPISDELNPGHFWVFGKELDKTEIYIKLKIVTYSTRNEKAICISFHPSERPMKYPFRR